VEVSITNANVEGVFLPLGSGDEIRGTVRVEGGDLQALMSSSRAGQGTGQIATTEVLNAAGALVAAGASVRPYLTLAEADYSGFGTPNTQIKEDGTFKLQGAAAAKYFVNLAALPEGAYVKLIHFGNQDVTHDMLDLTSGGGGVLDILLSPKAADVSGVVRDDKGDVLGGVQVTVWPKTPELDSVNSGVRSANTDQNGSFKVTGLAPGEYFAAAWDDPEPGLTQSSEFAAKFTGDAAAVKLGESAHETVSLKLISRERIAAEAAKLP